MNEIPEITLTVEEVKILSDLVATRDYVPDSIQITREDGVAYATFHIFGSNVIGKAGDGESHRHLLSPGGEG